MVVDVGPLTWLLPPAAGVAYIALWWVAEAGRLGGTPPGWVVAVAPFVAFGIVIGISQRWPAVALGLMGAVLALQLLVASTRFSDTSWPAYLPVLYAVFNISASGRSLVHRLSLPVTAGYAVAVASLLTLPAFGQGGWPVLYPTETGGPAVRSPADIASGATLLAGCFVAVGLAVGAWCAGLAMRAGHRALEARLRAQGLEHELVAAEEELIALSERDRLAQDVHDVMAHSLAVIAAQADGTRMTGQGLTPSTQDALTTIAEIARDGLQELRQLLDAAPDERGQGIADLMDLAGLADRVRAAGHDCDLVVFGDAKPLTSIRRLGVYRIVQEALTNALKHSGAQGSTRVTLDWRGPGLAILIATTPVAAAEATLPGRGIRGMQERARLAGGWLTATATADADADADENGVFIVSAFVPADEAPADEVVADEAAA